MKDFRMLFTTFIFIGIMLFIPKKLFAQHGPSYNMEFVRAIQFKSEDRNHILVVFKVIPTIKKFKLILSMKVTYEIGQGEKSVNVQKQTKDNIRIVIYGKDLAEKNKKLYALIKDQIQLETDEDVRLITFDFYDITTELINKMSITYGLWESNNPDIRNEARYNFTVEQVD